MTVDHEAQVLALLPLVEMVSRRLYPVCARDVREELRQDGIVGLIDAVTRFDPRHGALLRTYAGLRIRGAMIDGIRQWGMVTRRQRRAGQTGDGWVQWDTEAHEQTSRAAGPYEECLTRERVSAVRAAVRALPPRQQHYVVARQFHGRPVRDVAREDGVTVGAVEVGQYTAYRRLRVALASVAALLVLTVFPGCVSTCLLCPTTPWQAAQPAQVETR